VKRVAWATWAISAVVSVAWFWESSTCGFCYISRHLAPVAIVGNIIAPFLFLASRKPRNSP